MVKYMDDTFVIWKHSIEAFHNFLYHLNNSRTFIKFIEEAGANGHLRFLDVLIVKKEGSLTITVHRKPTHTGRYLCYYSNQPVCVK
jgi:hypothetical protein